MFYPSFAFKCSVIQQRETVVLESMSFGALSCKGGASISIGIIILNSNKRSGNFHSYVKCSRPKLERTRTTKKEADNIDTSR